MVHSLQEIRLQDGQMLDKGTTTLFYVENKKNMFCQLLDSFLMTVGRDWKGDISF